MLEVKVLGYPQIYVDGRHVESFLSNKVLVLLCYLVMNPQMHSRERLAGVLWGEMSDSKAKSNLRQALHDLGKKLGGYVDITRQSVQICQRADYYVDAIDLKQVVHSQEKNIENLQRVVALYRGVFLEGINLSNVEEIDDWLLTEREQLRLAYIDALSYLSDQHVIRGNWREAERNLRLLAIVEPLREETHRQIMVCLARQQRYTESILHYEEMQKILERELSVEPSFESRRVRDCILAARIRKPDRSLANLGQLFGRETEVHRIESTLIETPERLVTITGQGGIGKTHLAQHITSRNRMMFLNGAYYVSLEPINTSHDLVSTLCAELNVSFSAEKEALQSLIAALQHQEVLITLDNFEHLLEARSIVSEILERTHHVKVLVTSRERLNLRLEQVIELNGLPIPSTENLAQSSAFHLFESRTQQIKREFVITDVTAFIALCQHVEGMPLALELAAGWIDIYPLESIVSEIKSDLGLLTSSLLDLPIRHRSIHSLFNQTWHSFSTDQQRMLMNLTIFRGGFSADAAQHVGGISREDLRSFVNRSWVQVVGHGRYNLHMLIRQYLQEVMEQSQYDMVALSERHCQYFADFLYQFEGERFASPYTMGAMETMMPESDNLRQAWYFAVDELKLAEISKMLECYYALFTQQTWFAELLVALEYLLDRIGQHADDGLLSRIYCRLARTDYYLNSRRGNALASFETSFELASKVDDKVEIGHALHGLAACHMVSDWDTCIDYLQTCIETYEDTNDDVHAALAKNTLAEIYHFLGRKEESGILFRKSYEVLKSADDSRLLTPLRLWAGHASESGDFELARELFQEYLAIMDKIGGIHIEVYALQGLADIAFRCEEYDEAKHYYQNAWIASQQATPSLEALHGLGRIAIRQKNFDQAKDYFSRAIQNESDLDWYIRVLSDVVELFLAMGQQDLVRAVTYIVWLHPAAAVVHNDNVKRHLEHYEEAMTHDKYATPELKLAFVRGQIPQLSQSLSTSSSFFEARVAEIKQAIANDGSSTMP